MSRLITVSLGLLSYSATLVRAQADEAISHGDAETAELAAGRGLCGRGPLTPLQRGSSTCSKNLAGPLPFGPDPSDWYPWTHRPYCADTPYCVFTNADFHGRQGVSIITTPAIAAASVDEFEHAFTEPFQYPRFEDGGSAPFEIRDIPGKGKGVVALRRISRGERIMVDYVGVLADTAFPGAMRMADGRMLLESAVDQHPRREVILDLAKSTNTTTRAVEDLLRTNSFGGQHKEHERERNIMTLFPLISRMNHACNPNIYTRFSEKTLARSAMALKDIEPGEELAISYGELGLTREERQVFLRARWGFTCTCALCSLPEEDVKISDARRGEMEALRKVVVEHVHKSEFGEALRKHHRLLDLLAVEGVQSPMGEQYGVLARLYNAVGDRRGVETWAARAIEDLNLYGGEEMFEEMQDLQDLLDGI